MTNLPPQALTPPVDTLHYRAAFEKMRAALPEGYLLRIDWRLQAFAPCHQPHVTADSRAYLVVEVVAPMPQPVGRSESPIATFVGSEVKVIGAWKVRLFVDPSTGTIALCHTIQKDADHMSNPGVPADVLWAILNAAAAFKVPTATEGTGPE